MKSKSIEFFNVSTQVELSLPLIKQGIVAGFPSPAEDFLDTFIDLNKELIKNPSSTFYGRVKGTSMKDAGIDEGDILIIDRSMEPQTGKIALCFIDGDFTVKRLKIEKDVIYLVPENDEFAPIKVTSENELIIWGMVRNIIKYC